MVQHWSSVTWNGKSTRRDRWKVQSRMNCWGRQDRNASTRRGMVCEVAANRWAYSCSEASVVSLVSTRSSSNLSFKQWLLWHIWGVSEKVWEWVIPSELYSACWKGGFIVIACTYVRLDPPIIRVHARTQMHVRTRTHQLAPGQSAHP